MKKGLSRSDIFYVYCAVAFYYAFYPLIKLGDFFDFVSNWWNKPVYKTVTDKKGYVHLKKIKHFSKEVEK